MLDKFGALESFKEDTFDFSGGARLLRGEVSSSVDEGSSVWTERRRRYTSVAACRKEKYAERLIRTVFQ